MKYDLILIVRCVSSNSPGRRLHR